jgi:TonB family protein
MWPVPGFGSWGLVVLLLSQSTVPATNRQIRGVQATLADGTVMPTVVTAAPVELAADLSAPARVRVESVVDQKGSLVHTRVSDVSGPPGIAHAAVDALHKFQFRPAIRAQRPATVLAEIELTFDAARAGAVSPRVQIAAVAAQPLDDAPAVWAKAYRSDTKGLVLPRVLREILPTYTAAGMRAKIAGSVEMQVVILEDGTVGATRVTKSLDATHGLDRQALISARHWFFEPATLNGRPVPVSVVLVLEFQVR